MKLRVRQQIILLNISLFFNPATPPQLTASPYKYRALCIEQMGYFQYSYVIHCHSSRRANFLLRSAVSCWRPYQIRGGRSACFEALVDALNLKLTPSLAWPGQDSPFSVQITLQVNADQERTGTQASPASLSLLYSIARSWQHRFAPRDLGISAIASH